MQLDFTNQTALVTGASRGIGLQIAHDLLRCGAQVILTSTSARWAAPPALRDARHMQVDFTRDDSRGRFLKELAALPSLHVLVNNAGVAMHRAYEQATEADWDETHDVNLKAPYLVSQVAARIMTRQRYGRIVNVSSIWGHITMRERSVYTATKWGLRGVSVSLAAELAHHNVLVNTVSPGFTMTDMVRQNYSADRLREIEARIPMGRLATTEDISRAVLFLASDLNSYVTGQSLVVDGGYSII